MNADRRSPQAWDADDPSVIEVAEIDLSQLEVDEDTAHDAVSSLAHLTRSRFRWGRLAISAFVGLIMLALGLAAENLIRGLFSRWEWLGWLGIALVTICAAGIAVFIAREFRALWRLKQIARLRLTAERAIEEDSRPAANQVIDALAAIYSARADTARGRTAIAAHRREVMDGRDLLRLAERELVSGLDERTKNEIAVVAARVSAVTAVSPRAAIDLIYVLVESLRLIRKISQFYGGRPGWLGMIRLTRAVTAHLAVTGTMAVGDTILQQIVGPGLAARLSARLGEGVVNGLMTARIGLSAMDVARPLPFIDAERPKLRDLAGKLISRSADTEKTDR